MAWLLGTCYGLMEGSVGWSIAGAAFVVGLLRWQLWWPLAIAIAANIANLAMVYGWWQELGIADTWPVRTSWLLVAMATLSYLFYGLGRFFRAFDGETTRQPSASEAGAAGSLPSPPHDRRQ